jgi:RNA polymerase sigma factor (sigma-70 family)
MDRLTVWLTRNARWLMTQLRRRGRTREEAEDLIQEAYLRVYEYCEKGKAREPERVLVRTVMRLSMNEWRDRRRHLYSKQSVEDLLLVDPAPPPEDVLAVENYLRQIVSTLNNIEPRTREAFHLHRVEGLSYAQISRQMGISVSAVEKHIAWAMAVLLDQFDRQERG